MNANFEKALKFVLQWEGGYVNDPSDRGGATNQGITQGTFNSYRRKNGKEAEDVRGITPSEVADIYLDEYWRKISADSLSTGLDVSAFDFAVNSGSGRVLKYLLSHPNCTAADLNDYRETFYRAIGIGTQAKFLKGWLNRLNALRTFIAGI